MQRCRFLKLSATLLQQPRLQGCQAPLVQRRFHSTSTAAFTRTDYLKVLGLAEGASAADIKQAYYNLSLQLHPDTNPGDEDAHTRFMAVLEAYERLNDVARNPQDVISRMEKERETTWKPNTANMDDIMRKARDHLEEHYHKLADDPSTQPPPPETAAHFRLLTTQIFNVGALAAVMLSIIYVIHSLEHS
eukprot:scpid62860/ scgid9920/ Chaperone protein DnaJ